MRIGPNHVNVGGTRCTGLDKVNSLFAFSLFEMSLAKERAIKGGILPPKRGESIFS